MTTTTFLCHAPSPTTGRRLRSTMRALRGTALLRRTHLGMLGCTSGPCSLSWGRKPMMSSCSSSISTFGEPLTEALWSARREVYGDGSVRRPYIATGAFPQRLRPMRGDVPAYVARCLLRSLRQWEVYLARGGPRSDRSRKNVESIIRYYERELHHSRKRWPHVFARSGAADK